MPQKNPANHNCAACCWRRDEGIFNREFSNHQDCPSQRNLIPFIYAELQESSLNQQCICCSITVEAIRKFLRTTTSFPIEVNFYGFIYAETWLQGDAEHIEVFTTTRGRPPYGIPRREIPPGDTSSDASLGWVQDWLANCLLEHSECRGGASSVLPTRVLDLISSNGSSDVKLIDGTESIGPTRYAALSHCWGSVIPECRTTKRTLDERKACIRFDQLPLTFREAIEFTRKIGVRYLWIDSICIIQDDIQDWSHEAARMHDVYGNAFVTLAAVHASDCQGGLFAKISEEFKSHPLRTLSADGKEWQLFARRKLPPFHDWHRVGTPSPLFTRAWAYQERLVSPRVVYFTAHELLWECLEQVGCECSGSPSITKECQPSEANDCPKIRHVKSRNEWTEATRWHQIINEYSHLSLKVETDRLPAISAIAKQIQQHRTSDQYLDGLWHTTLIQDLLWVGNGCQSNGQRVLVGHAPTWSWASITPCGKYILDQHGPHEPSDQYFLRLLEIKRGDVEDEVVSNIEPTTLKLHAQVVECTLDLQNWVTELRHPSTDKALDFISDCSKDDKPNHDALAQGQTLYVMRVSQGSKRARHLVIRKASQVEDVYHRVGLLAKWWHPGDDLNPDHDLIRISRLFDSAEIRIITLK